MEPLQVIVHVLGAAELAEAERALSLAGDVVATAGCVYGEATEETISALEAAGLTVEVAREPRRRPPRLGATPGLENLSYSPEESYLRSDGSKLSQCAREATKVYVVEVTGPLRPDRVEALEKDGVRPLRLLGGGDFTVAADAALVGRLEAWSWVRRVREYNADDTARGVVVAPSNLESHEPKEWELVFVPAGPPDPALAIEGTQDPRFETLVAELRAHDAVATVEVVGRGRARFGCDDDALVAELRARKGVRAVTTERVFDAVWHDAASPDVARAIEALRVDPRCRDLRVGERFVRFTCERDSDLISTLAAAPQVASLSEHVAADLGSVWARRVVGVERLPAGGGAVVGEALPWTGKGVTVAVADSGVDEAHPDLVGRLAKVIRRVPDVAGDPAGHGTHVCGTIVGTGHGCDGKVRGVAPEATLVVQCLADAEGNLKGKPLNLAELFAEAYAAGARIHSNSWGTKTDGRVSSDCLDVDRFVYEHPDFFVLFAAGNDGRWGESGAVSATLRAPALGKNVLAVGACCSARDDGPYFDRTDTYHLADGADVVERFTGEPGCVPKFSARGPSDDGRVKPDLVAPGTSILSTWAAGVDAAMPDPALGARYAWMSGTSMATPVVAGAAACVRQYLVDARNVNPSAALMRAMLVHATRWIDRVTSLDEEVGRPNFHQGHGRLDLGVLFDADAAGSAPVVLLRDIDRKADDALYANKALSAVKGRATSWRARVKVRDGATRPLRVTLAWTDLPERGLQQDLDLRVRGPAMARPLSGNPAHKRAPRQPMDRENNVEHVVIDAPAPGEYLVAVEAFATPREPQGYALVVSGDLENSDWIPDEE